MEHGGCESLWDGGAQDGAASFFSLPPFAMATRPRIAVFLLSLSGASSIELVESLFGASEADLIQGAPHTHVGKAHCH